MFKAKDPNLDLSRVLCNSLFMLGLIDHDHVIKIDKGDNKIARNEVTAKARALNSDTIGNMLR